MNVPKTIFRQYDVRGLVGDEVTPELAASGCLFVVSAFESVDDAVLTILDKGHTARDETRAIVTLRAAGTPTAVPTAMPTAINR